MSPLLFSLAALASPIEVVDADGLRAAMNDAVAGDEIVLAPGTYRFTSRVNASTDGTVDEPIIVRAADPSATKIEMDTVEGFYVSGAHWVFEDLVVEGVCASDTSCEHAYHIVGAADGTVIRRNVLLNFNAQIKANGMGQVFPNDVVIEGCEMANDAPRQTSNPVTPIDIVGGQRWVIRSNYIHDFAKAEGNQISYAAFLKGNSRDGTFENNLVVCSADHDGFTRVGLSLGGGGTYPDSVCEDDDCSVEHTGGVLRNNIIAHCSDVGVYLNEAADTVLSHNLLYDTNGIDVRFEVSSAFLDGNVLDAAIRERNGGLATLGTNLQSYGGFASTYRDPSTLDFRVDDATDLADLGGEDVDFDFCWNPRTGGADLGAMEEGSDCDTTRPTLPRAAEDGEDGSPGGAGDDGGTDSPEDSSPMVVEAGCGCTHSGGHRGLFSIFLGLLAVGRRRADMTATR